MNKLVLVLLLLFVQLPAFGQPKAAYSVAHYVHDIESIHLREKRQILVHVPLTYDNSGRKYPVIYMLDGHTPHPEMMAGIIANQSWGRQMPEMILVSIRNINRTRDMTPTRVGRSGGGVVKFLDYLEKEVIPLVEANYRVEPYRIFAGHSLAGLTVVHTLVNRPDVFNAYIAASPYLQWDKNLVVTQAAENFKIGKLEKTIFLGLGDEKQYLEAWNKFQGVLKKTKPKGLEYEFREYRDDSHGSVVLPTYYDGLRKIFDGWAMKGRIRIDTVRPHYKKLSKRFGYKVAPPEDLLNASGYFLMREKKYSEALDVLRENAENYPTSPNVFDSLGECYEKMGKMREARANYEKAVKLAEAQGDSRLAETAKANLARVSDN